MLFSADAYFMPRATKLKEGSTGVYILLFCALFWDSDTIFEIESTAQYRLLTVNKADNTE